MSKSYVLSWDCTGLESVICVSDIAKEETWQALMRDHTKDDDWSGRSETATSIVWKLMMRARFNTHRHYEIYIVEVDDTITPDDIRDWFDQSPQDTADLIRARGRQLYSDRLQSKKVRIT